MGLVKKGPSLKDKPCGREWGDGYCYLCLGMLKSFILKIFD